MEKIVNLLMTSSLADKKYGCHGIIRKNLWTTNAKNYYIQHYNNMLLGDFFASSYNPSFFKSFKFVFVDAEPFMENFPIVGPFRRAGEFNLTGRSRKSRNQALHF